MVVPLCIRIQPSVWLSSRLTKNIRSASPRCAMEKIEIRGLPVGVCNIFAMSSGGPSSQVENPGEARRLLNFNARTCRDFSGRNDSRSITPTLSKAGRWMCRIRISSVRSPPCIHACWKMADNSTASGVRSDSPPAPTSDSNDDTVLSIRSPNNSESSTISNGGAANELRIDTGIPARLPGVNTVTSTFSRSVATRSGVCPHSASPFFHSAAVFSACSSVVSPFFAASSTFTHGRKLAASSSGNVSSRLEMSPFGSITIAGMLSIAASSNSARQRPVLPDPVIPSTTPWVTRSFESYSTRSPDASRVPASYPRPR